MLVVRGGEDDLGIVVDGREDLEPRHGRQAHVEEDEVGPQPVDLRDGGRAVGGLADALDPPDAFEQGTELLASERLVVDDQRGRRLHGWTSVATGPCCTCRHSRGAR